MKADGRRLSSRFPRRVAVAAAGLFLVTVALYIPVIRFDFLNWDDLDYVTQNDNVRGGFTWTGFVWAFTSFHSANWHPVTWLSHMLDCEVFGLNAGGHHFTNALLHAVNAALLFLLLTRLLRNFTTEAQRHGGGKGFTEGNEGNKGIKARETPGGRRRGQTGQFDYRTMGLSEAGGRPSGVLWSYGPMVLWSSFFVAAVFALHPIRVESVAWVSERKDLLSGFFFLLTLWAYGNYVRKRTIGPSDNRTIRPDSSTKETKGTGLTTENTKNTEGKQASEPDATQRRGEARGAGEESDTKAFNTKETKVTKGEGGTIGQWDHSTIRPSDHSTTQSYSPMVLWSYSLSLVFFALGLMSKPMLVTVPFVLLLLDWWPLNRFGLRSDGPMVGLSNSPSDSPDSPMVGLSNSPSFTALVKEKIPFFGLTAISCVVTFLAQKSGGAVAGIEAVPFGARMQNAVAAYAQYILKFLWPTQLSPIYRHQGYELWTVVLAGVLLLGITLAAWRLRKSRPWLFVGWFWFVGMLVPVIGIVQVGSQALADRYTYLPLIGLALAIVFEADHWLRRSRRAVSLSAALGALMVLVSAWATHRQLSFWRNTQTLFARAIELDPQNVQALFGLGSDLLEKGDNSGARQYIERVLALKPDHAEALGSMASLLDAEARYADAIKYYQAALDAHPDHDGALNNLAWLLATCPDPAFRDGPEAVRLATRACEVTRHTKPIYIGTLGAAHAQAGSFDAAIASAQRAADLARALNLPEVAARNEELIGRYSQGKTALD